MVVTIPLFMIPYTIPFILDSKYIDEVDNDDDDEDEDG